MFHSEVDKFFNIVVFDVLQHRIGISYEAEAENMSSVDVITKIVNEIAVP